MTHPAMHRSPGTRGPPSVLAGPLGVNPPRRAQRWWDAVHAAGQGVVPTRQCTRVTEHRSSEQQRLVAAEENGPAFVAHHLDVLEGLADHLLVVPVDHPISSHYCLPIARPVMEPVGSLAQLLDRLLPGGHGSTGRSRRTSTSS